LFLVLTRHDAVLTQVELLWVLTLTVHFEITFTHHRLIKDGVKMKLVYLLYICLVRK